MGCAFNSADHAAEQMPRAKVAGVLLRAIVGL